MIGEFGGIIVMVSDQQKAVDFYTKKLGFDVKFDSDEGAGQWVTVAPKNMITPISLVIPNSNHMDSELLESSKRRIGENTGIWFYTDDIDTTYDELKSKDVEITKPEKQVWGGIMSEFKDQDGNIFGIVDGHRDD